MIDFKLEYSNCFHYGHFEQSLMESTIQNSYFMDFVFIALTMLPFHTQRREALALNLASFLNMVIHPIEGW